MNKPFLEEFLLNCLRVPFLHEKSKNVLLGVACWTDLLMVEFCVDRDMVRSGLESAQARQSSPVLSCSPVDNVDQAEINSNLGLVHFNNHLNSI